MKKISAAIRIRREFFSQSITDQNKKLGMSMGEIRRRANPDIVQLSNADHGQTGVDAIKSLDNETVLDTRASTRRWRMRLVRHADRHRHNHQTDHGPSQAKNC